MNSMRLALLVLVAATLVGCGSGPHLVVPTPRAADYASLEPFAVHAVSQNEVFAVGVARRNDDTPEGLILGSTDGGRNWRRLAYAHHDLGRVVFSSVWFNDRLRGWVGGVRTHSDGRTVPVVFATSDGGNRWREVELLQDSRALTTGVHGLNFTDDREGSVQVELVDPASGGVHTTVFRSVDAGRTWIAATWRGPLAVPADPTKSWVGADQTVGSRLTPTGLPGVTAVQKTASSGRDWVEMSVLEAGQMDSWWGGPADH